MKVAAKTKISFAENATLRTSGKEAMGTSHTWRFQKKWVLAMMTLAVKPTVDIWEGQLLLAWPEGEPLHMPIL